jgi:hypothetical protein
VNIDADITGKLNEDEGVNALVGQKIYRDIAARQDDYPYVIFRRPESQAFDDSEGEVFEEKHTVYVDCVGSTPAQAKAVAKAVRAALAESDFDYQGQMGGWAEDYTGYEDTFTVIRQVYEIWGLED